MCSSDLTLGEVVRRLLVDGPEDRSRLDVGVLVNPLTDVVEFLLLAESDHLRDAVVLEVREDAAVDASGGRVALQLVQSSAPVREVLLDDSCHDLFVVGDFVLVEDRHDSLHELRSELGHLLLRDAEVDDRAPRVKRVDDLVLEVAGQDEAAVLRELDRKSTRLNSSHT